VGLVIFVHLGVWINFFSRLPVGQSSPFSIYEKYYVPIKYPAPNKPLEIVKYLPSHFVNMFSANLIFQKHPAASFPWEWPVGLGEIPIFISAGKDAVIVLSGNNVGWWMIPVSVVMALVLLASPLKRYWASVSRDNLLLPVWGYVICLAPLFFVERALFLYHYFSPLLWGYLLVPVVVEYGQIRWGKWANWGYMLLVAAGFLLTAPVTYAWAVWSPWVKFLTK
jgi:dolichyl-phosphate-mannose--protein O-mannosyl transferase